VSRVLRPPEVVKLELAELIDLPRDCYEWQEINRLIDELESCWMSPWVSVKERLPEEGEPVLMLCRVPVWGEDDPNDGGVLQLGIFLSGEFRADKEDGWYAGIVSDWLRITPLPEPPKEGA
jgi:hypothetical protein